jgi:hypothetical protein
MRQQLAPVTNSQQTQLRIRLEHLLPQMESTLGRIPRSRRISFGISLTLRAAIPSLASTTTTA